MPFNALDAEAEDPRLYRIDTYSAPPGTDIFKEGEPADAVFTLREGFVKLWHQDGQGSFRIARLLKAGDFVGLEALVQPDYALGAATMSQAGLCRIPVDLLHRLGRENDGLHREVQARWHSQLLRTDQLQSTVVSGPSRSRVIKLLRYMHDFAAPENVPRMRRTDMAGILGISSETAARVIAELKKAGVLTETSVELLFDPAELPD